jgi:hypothetical protein
VTVLVVNKEEETSRTRRSAELRNLPWLELWTFILCVRKSHRGVGRNFVAGGEGWLVPLIRSAADRQWLLAIVFAGAPRAALSALQLQPNN